MIRVVLDTNVVVSAQINENGLEAAVLDMAVSRIIHLYTSKAILAEYESVLNRSSLGLDSKRVSRALKGIRKVSTVTKPTRMLEVSSDLADNRFLECAEAANADYLITGNKRHFPRTWQDTKVVTARAFFDLMGPELARGSKKKRQTVKSSGR